MTNIRSKKTADFPFDILHIYFLLKNRDLKWETGSFSCRLDECFNYDTHWLSPADTSQCRKQKRQHTTYHNCTHSVTFVTFEISVPTVRELLYLFPCNMFAPERPVVFGQSEMRLALSVFPHGGESGTRTPSWRTSLVGESATTQSKSAPASTS